MAENNVKSVEEQRKELISQYNKENAGVSELIDETVDEKFVKATKEDWEVAVKAFQTRTFIIADSRNAVRVAKFLKTWNEKFAAWEKDQWIGVVKFDKFINDFLKEFEKREQDLVIDYGCLGFLYTLMMKPCGVGLASAKKMQSIDEEYNKILNTISDLKEDTDKQQLEIKKKQEVWAAACAGFKLRYLTDEEREKWEQTTVLGDESRLEGTVISADKTE